VNLSVDALKHKDKEQLLLKKLEILSAIELKNQ